VPNLDNRLQECQNKQEGGIVMTEEKRPKLPYNPWRGWKPGGSRKYDPKDPHFDPMHPPEGYPKEELEKEWGETFDDEPAEKETSGN